MALLTAYYAWVLGKFFRDDINRFISGLGKSNGGTNPSLDDLACALSIQRKLLANPQAKLERHEEELMARDPFRTLILSGSRER